MSDTTRFRLTTILLILAVSILAWPVFAERPGTPPRAPTKESPRASSPATFRTSPPAARPRARE